MPSRFVRCRIPCELLESDRTSRAIAVNLSERGLFVQTGVTLSIDTPLRVHILETTENPDLVVAARVARVKKVHPGARLVVARGIGLEVLETPDAWRELTTRLGCRTADEAAPPATGDPTFGLPLFRIVLRQKDGIRIRTRVVNVACLDAEQARAGVVADLDEGWEIVKIERQSPPADSAIPLLTFRVVALRARGFRRWETTLSATSAEEAQRAVVADLGTGWRIESMEAVGAGEPPGDATPEPAETAAPPDPNARLYQVRARHVDGARVRTRVEKLRAASEEEAAGRVVEHLGEGWQAVKVTPLEPA